MNAAQRHTLYQRLQQDNPHPRSELVYQSPFELLIAVILSAQATDVGVNKATAKLYPVAHTPEAIYALGVEGLTPYIKSIGLYRGKAKNIIETCRLLLERHQGMVPQTREALEALPGVGRKTANVVLNTAFGQPTLAVDTHIFRVSNRTGLASGKNVLEVERNLLRNTPKEFLMDAHHWLILHGRYVCKARKPQCGSCRIEDLCDFPDKTTSD
ncbi:DNA-(apurinic or apyrimidinic site) lyase /endonuclease III [Azomonas agilis]|uniref:Endonuclease III n=1 Tax=Azomonas agilis TaxID=116849 RepID=A0A562J113_9GAMM|nr:endonuclease III [Azomonas agilis]TWH76485.1 DNA-(apurinic or apyrimidinic site) lyase /endonuclease III [Azomonas agilis]